jgi:Sulfatase
MEGLVKATRGLLLALGIAGIAHVSLAADVSPQPESAFKGKVEDNAKDSIPDWPLPINAPKDAPNIVVILLDDIGFADTSTFGGVAQTPELDKLAAQGLRYNNFSVAAMCSPTRAALLSGRNHHRVGFGMIADDSGGYPGYNSIWKKSTASVAEVLRLNGYSTAAFGKWHNTPDWEITPTGPFDRWPTGLGFDYFYGFMGPAGDETNGSPRDFIVERHRLIRRQPRSSDITSPVISPMRRSIGFIRMSHCRRIGPISFISLPAPCTSRITCPKNGSPSTEVISIRVNSHEHVLAGVGMGRRYSLPVLENSRFAFWRHAGSTDSGVAEAH